jgi:hypothetical protein
MIRKFRSHLLSLFSIALIFSLPLTSCNAEDQPQSTIHTARSLEAAPKKDSTKKKPKKEAVKPKVESFRTNDPLNI